LKQKIRVVRKKKHGKYYILFYLYMLLVLLSLFVAVSYTWFTMSRVPRVTDMNVYITSVAGLELSATPADEESWELQLDIWKTECVPTVLRPVTWSEDDQCFWAANYSADGRLLEIKDWARLNDARNANIELAEDKKDHVLDGYYMKSTFYARCGLVAEVTLSDPVVLDERGEKGSGTYVIGTPKWNSDKIEHENRGAGAESAIRFGFRMTPCSLDMEGNLEEKTSGPLIIYEPNADLHADKTGDYLQTPSINGYSTLVGEQWQNRLILQHGTTWAEQYPVEINKIKLTHGGFFKDQKPTLFSIKPGEVVKIEMYIWLEGQDADCTNILDGAMHDAQIWANIQFSGLEERQNTNGLDIIDETAIPAK